LGTLELLAAVARLALLVGLASPLALTCS
jgi:hypothetical protein